MAQWWELAIPAAATLLGGWTGAWWQSRSTERQLEWQAREAQRTRMHEDSRQERTRWFDERRKAYGQLGEAVYGLAAAAGDYRGYAAEVRASTGVDQDLEKKRDAAMAQYRAAADAARVALVAAEVVGSERQAELARKLREQMTLIVAGTGGFENLEALRDQFLEQAREELGQPAVAPPSDGSETAV